MIDSAVMTVIVPLGRKFSAARNSPMLRRSSLAGGVVGPSFGAFGAGEAPGFGAGAAGVGFGAGAAEVGFGAEELGAGVEELGAGFGAGADGPGGDFPSAEKPGARGVAAAGFAVGAAGSAGRLAPKGSAGLSAGLPAPLSAGLAGRGSCRLSVGLASTSMSAPFFAGSPSFGVRELTEALDEALMAAAMLGFSEVDPSLPAAASGSFRSSASSIADRAAAAASWILPVIAI